MVAGGGGDLRLVARAHQSEVDFSSGVVAVVTPARTANLLEANISGTIDPKPESLPLAVLILGPTGSGKTALSLDLAERFGGEIVSCDSVAVYRGMDLGTAKPTLAERERVPHYLIDVAEPVEPFTAGEYSRRARAALLRWRRAGACRL